jgi:hypothetical protein
LRIGKEKVMVSVRNKIIAYIEACKNDEETEEMDKCLFSFTEKELKIMNGGHCAYVNALDENGKSILGKLVKDFITD